MGNRACKTNIAPFFDKPLPKTPIRDICVRLQLEDIFDDQKPFEIDLIFTVDRKLRKSKVFQDAPTERITWRPRSMARDFEVIDAFTSKEKRLARGQVIGVVIVECLTMYCKIIWPDFDSRTKSNRVEVLLFNWNRENGAKETLQSDLCLGYDVLFLAEENASKVHRLQEKSDEDSDRCEIFVLELADQGLENYVAHVQKKLTEKKQVDCNKKDNNPCKKRKI